MITKMVIWLKKTPTTRIKSDKLHQSINDRFIKTLLTSIPFINVINTAIFAPLFKESKYSESQDYSQQIHKYSTEWLLNVSQNVYTDQ